MMNECPICGGLDCICEIGRLKRDNHAFSDKIDVLNNEQALGHINAAYYQLQRRNNGDDDRIIEAMDQLELAIEILTTNKTMTDKEQLAKAEGDSADEPRTQ